MRKPTLLVVDDEADNLDALERIFRKRYHFLRANSANEALGILKLQPEIDVIITDQRMPSMTGVELLESTLVTHPNTVRILLTGFTEIDSIIAAVNKGHIFRYITKPWDTTDLINSVEQAMAHYSRGVLLEEKNQELEKALLELEQLDQAKTKFMVLINHELKTPLTVMNSFISLLQETPLTDEQRTYLDRIWQSCQRFEEITNDTLILTQFAAGKLNPKRQAVVMSPLFNTAIAGVKTLADKKSILLNLDNHLTNDSTASCDPALIQRALQHLLKNAIRFSPNNSEVNIVLEWIDDSIKITLENLGGPVADSIINNIGTPFTIPTEIMNHSKGLGLGLTVVDAILNVHESTLNIQNCSDTRGSSKVRVSFSLKK